MKDNIFSFNATVQGDNHIKANKICEDYSCSYDNDDKYIHICVVADGHGSDNYPRSSIGAKIAGDVAIEHTKNFILQGLIDENHYDKLQSLARNILEYWYRGIIEDFKNNKFTEEEIANVEEKYKKMFLEVNDLDDIDSNSKIDEQMIVSKAYGTTLIIFAVTNMFSFGMQIGDGKCVALDENFEFIEPIPWDENCVLNRTTSICDKNALDEFRYYISKKQPVAVFCCSDGIDDSYTNIDELKLLYKSMLKIYVDYDKKTAEQEIKEYLPILSKRGSGDDVSIANIINISKLTENKNKISNEDDEKNSNDIQ